MNYWRFVEVVLNERSHREGRNLTVTSTKGQLEVDPRPSPRRLARTAHSVTFRYRSNTGTGRTIPQTKKSLRRSDLLVPYMIHSATSQVENAR